jgi:putative exosortase-associated protein (TIGR04073 family)
VIRCVRDKAAYKSKNRGGNVKKSIAALLVIIMVAFTASAGYCETPAFRKFRRGFCNILTSHLELVHQMEKEGAKGGTGRAMTLGVFNGISMTTMRMLAGVYEVVTFPIPAPAGYKPILTDPEFYWTEPFAESKIGK